jgi:hypothetical protein
MAPDRERIASAGGASRLLRLHDVVLAGSLFKPAQTYTLKARLGKTEKVSQMVAKATALNR